MITSKIQRRGKNLYHAFHARCTEELLDLLAKVAKRVGQTPNWVANRAARSLHLRPLSFKDAQAKLNDTTYNIRIKELCKPGDIKKGFMLSEKLPEGTTSLVFRMRLAEKLIEAENCKPYEPYIPTLRAGIDYIVVDNDCEDIEAEE